MTAADLVHEWLVLWPAWQSIASYVSRDDPRTADPCSVFGAACAVDHDRLAARLYGEHLGDSLEDAASILDELLEMARAGRRPRYGAELGLTREMFQRPEADAA